MSAELFGRLDEEQIKQVEELDGFGEWTIKGKRFSWSTDGQGFTTIDKYSLSELKEIVRILEGEE